MKMARIAGGAMKRRQNDTGATHTDRVCPGGVSCRLTILRSSTHPT